jgi:N-acetyl sugar amidotransferase
VLPDTKPYLTFDHQGVCSACRAHERKRQLSKSIRWRDREKAFDRLVNEAKRKRAPFYDAVVPVSGGKDSLTQVHRLLHRSLRILAVNVDYGLKTEIGWHNLNCIPSMGAHLMVYRPDQRLHRRLIRIGFQDFGDPDLLSHTLLHAYPLRVALQFKVPLVLLGENSAFEYGGQKSLADLYTINRDWFSKYAANAGRDARYLSRHYGIPFDTLRVYDYPDELDSSPIQAVFMSYFFNWDSEKHLAIAQKHGFQTLQTRGEGTYRNYVGIDEKFNRLHQYIKVLKFGYGRATDHACEDIRAGRLSREKAKSLVRKYDLEELSDNLVKTFVSYLGVTRSRFFAVLERYRNRDIWKRSNTGRWNIPGHLEG